MEPYARAWAAHRGPCHPPLAQLLVARLVPARTCMDPFPQACDHDAFLGQLHYFMASSTISRTSPMGKVMVATCVYSYRRHVDTAA